jgi:hypothetical protein
MTPERPKEKAAAARQANRIKALRGIWTDDGGTDALLVERRRDRKREKRKAQNRGVDRP